MRWPGRRRAARGFAWLRSRGRARAMILGYHRVGDYGEDLYGLALRAEAFERHLEAVARHARPVFLSELVSALRDRTIAPRMVAVTFDDAYSETLRIVEPLLRTHGVPATVFVPTGLLGSEAWWDRLSRILSAEVRLPQELVLPIGGEVPLRRRLCEAERSSARRGRHRARLADEVFRALRSLVEHDRAAALDRLEEWVGGAVQAGRADSVISPSDLVELDRSDVFEVGSHSVTHPVLSELPLDPCRTELEKSRGDLEQLLGHRVDLFSYPNGTRNSHTDALVREAGYRGACASRPGVATVVSHPYSLPRFWPVDRPNDVERLISRWL